VQLATAPAVLLLCARAACWCALTACEPTLPSLPVCSPLVQYAPDFYPPFASGCGFVLSRDLVQALLQQPLPDYRLLVSVSTSHQCYARATAPAAKAQG
jgi:hypothetical protein